MFKVCPLSSSPPPVQQLSTINAALIQQSLGGEDRADSEGQGEQGWASQAISRKVGCCTGRGSAGTAVVALVPAIVASQEIFALHLSLEASDIPVAEVFAQLLHLFQLKQVDPQHLDRSDHKLVCLLTVTEQGPFILLLMLHKSLDINVEALAGGALRGLCGELALLKEESKEGEERVLVDLSLVCLKLGLIPGIRKGWGLCWLCRGVHVGGLLLVHLCWWGE